MSDSVWPHRWQPTRLLCPWDSPGKNTGVDCHFLLQCMKVKSESEVAQSCPILSDCSLPGSSVRGIFKARVLEWVAIGDLQNQSPAFSFSAKPPALMEKQMVKSSISIRAQLVTEAAHQEGSSIVVMFLTPCHIQFLQLSIIESWLWKIIGDSFVLW